MTQPAGESPNDSAPGASWRRWFMRVFFHALPIPRPIAWPPPRDESAIYETLRYARLRYPLGHQVHTAVAMVYLLLLPWMTAPKDIASAVLFFYAVGRLPVTWRCYTALLRQPLFWLLMLWAGWSALTLLWSDNRTTGFEHLQTFRTLLLVPVCWPILDRLPWLIGAALAGVVGQHVFQVTELLHWTDVRPDSLRPGRSGGWIHPIQTGAWCMAAVCFNGAAVLVGRGKLRIISGALLLLALAGLWATQSRGPWLATAVVVPLMLIIIAIRRPDSRRFVLLLAVVGVAGGIALWPVVSSTVRTQLHTTAEERRLAVDENRYWTDTGMRVGLWDWALQLYRAHPVGGVGVGSYQKAVEQLPDFQHAVQVATEFDPEVVDRMRRDHPHSTPLNTLACTGSVGFVILLTVIIAVLVQAWCTRWDHPYAPACFVALLGWLIGAQFDCYELNGHLLGLFSLLVAATMPHRAPIRYHLRAAPDAESKDL